MSNNNFNYFATEAELEKVEDTEETAVENVSDDKVEEVVAEVEEVSVSGTDSVVVYALRDLSKPGATALTKGYNTITKNQYKKWQGTTSVRIASQDEIEKYVK